MKDRLPNPESTSSPTPNWSDLETQLDHWVAAPSEPTPDEWQTLCRESIQHGRAIESRYNDMKIILDVVVDHGTALENSLSSENKVVSSSRDQYQFIMNSIPDLMALIDRQFRVEVGNVSFYLFFDAQPDGTQTIFDVCRDPVLIDWLNGAFALAFEGEVQRAKLWIVRNGDHRDCVDLQLIPFSTTEMGLFGNRNKDRSNTHCVFSARLITQSERSQETIRAQAELLDRAQDMIIAFDVHGVVTFWNRSAEQVYGIPRDHVLGQPIENALLRDVDPAQLQEVWETVTRLGNWTGEMRHRSAAGDAILVESRWTLIQDDVSGERTILSINTNVTDKKELEAQFLRSQRMESVGLLASGIAHDLNNVLSPFFLAVQALRPKLPDEKSQNILRLLESSAHRGAALVRQILTFARGADGLQMPIDMASVIEEVCQIVTETFPSEVELRYEPAEGIWRVLGDGTQIHQVVLNLCLNAKDAMLGGGKLTLCLMNAVVDAPIPLVGGEIPRGHYVTVSVIDTGTGMEEAVIKRIFEPFFTTKIVGKGTGLGLSSAAMILKNHNAYLQVKSTVGEGSVFHLYFPALAPATPA